MFVNTKITKISVSIILFVVIFLGLLLYYNFTFSRHHAKVTLVDIGVNNELLFETTVGEEIKVKSPEILIPLLYENKKYIITVYSNKLRGPFLKSIKEAEE